MNFAHRLKQLRKDYDLTQEALAIKLSSSRSTIAGYETERKEPDYETLKKIANFFNVSTDYLLGRTDVKEVDCNASKGSISQIEDVEKAMKVILDQQGLMLNGEMLSDESKIIIANALLMGIKTVEEINKNKKTNNKE